MATSPRFRVIALAATLTPALIGGTAVSAHATTTARPVVKVVAVRPVPQVVTQTNVAAKATTTYTVSIARQKQKKSYWCAPAAGRALLSRFGTPPSQSYLAGIMHTTASNGTSNANYVRALNNATGSHEFINVHPSSQSKLWGAVQVVKRDKWALSGRVLFGYKPWGSHTSDKTGHMIVAYGFSTSGGKFILWWDPWDNTNHKASLAKSWAAISKGGKNVWG